jgi:hypothetical protein
MLCLCLYLCLCLFLLLYGTPSSLLMCPTMSIHLFTPVASIASIAPLLLLFYLGLSACPMPLFVFECVNTRLLAKQDACRYTRAFRCRPTGVIRSFRCKWRALGIQFFSIFFIRYQYCVCAAHHSGKAQSLLTGLSSLALYFFISIDFDPMKVVRPFCFCPGKIYIVRI